MTIRLKIENLEAKQPDPKDDHNLRVTLPNYNGDPILIYPGEAQVFVLFGGGVIEVEEA